jgi:CheY-like chemotaxis protein
MQPEVAGRIFQPFYTTKGAGKGTGLGLSQVYRIVKNHDGYIDVESQVGQGTAMTVYLERIAEQGVKVAEARLGIPEGRGETVLLVEDQEAVREVTKAMLERLRYRVLPASDGHSALELFDGRANEVDLVLTDVVMPGLGGAQFRKALKERAPELPVLIMTGHELEDEEQWDLLSDVAGLLKKPVSLMAMAQAVQEALKGDG